MGQRERIIGAVFGLALAGAAPLIAVTGSGDATAVAGVAPDGPNVVVIQTDDQTLESMRVMEETNALLADEGATFLNNFTNFPLCCPSRATQLTGQYAHNHGVEANVPPRGGYQAFSRHNNLATWLETAGYRVGHVGKFLNGYGPSEDSPVTPYDDVTEVPPGWTEWRTNSNGARFNYYDYFVNEWSDAEGDRSGEIVAYGDQVADHRTDVTTQDALALLDSYAQQSTPFYLQVDYLAPHAGGAGSMSPQPPNDCGRAPRPAPRHATDFDGTHFAPADDPSFNEAAIRDKPPSIRRRERLDDETIATLTKRYECELESLLAVDEGVKDIIDELGDEGELANTFVFFTSDNGFFHGEHRVRSGKKLVYEPAVRVPLLVRGPGIRSGIRVQELTTNADFAATVLDVTRAQARRTKLDGQSLIRVTRRPARETGRELLIEGAKYDAIRTERYKLTRYQREGNFVELYDLREDPFELQNVARKGRYFEVVARLSDRLSALRDCAGRACRKLPALRDVYELDGPGGRCVDRRLTVAIKGPDANGIDRVQFRIGQKVVDRDTLFPFIGDIRRAELGNGKRVKLTAVVELTDGRRVIWRKTIKLCR